jgi:predicted transcriptional regulator of viral defense system
MNDTKILEKILVEHGRVVDYKTISAYYYNLSNINNKISSLIAKGWLVNLKKGVYYITKLGSLGSVTISNYVIAGIIGNESFISFEGALKYHGLFDQGIKKLRSISQIQYLSKEIEETRYEFIKVQKENYFGYSKEKVETEYAHIAKVERALLDLIEYQRTVYSVSLVIEKLQNYQDEINSEKLVENLKNYSQVTVKMVGVIFDALEMNSEEVFKLINSDVSTSRLFKSSDKFDTKWRIYYDSILNEQLQ